MSKLYLMNFVDMWDLKDWPSKILRIRLTKIEFESNFSTTSQHLSAVTFLLQKFLKIRPSEIGCDGDFSSLSQ